MKKVVVCYKWVWDDADLRVDAQTRKLNFEKARHKISEYDRNAIEAGVQVKAATGAELIGLTCGTEVVPSLKDSLSRGLDAVEYINDPRLGDTDHRVTAKVLAGAIRAMGPVDLVICGEGSSDEYAQQINARLAAQLGFASVSCVNQMDAADGTLRLERKLEDGIEKVEVSGPAVISVMPDINDPPIPSLKQILGAKKKPSTARSLDDIDLADADLVAGIEVRSVLSPVVTRGSVRLNEEGVSMADAVGRLVDQLKADNIIT